MLARLARQFGVVEEELRLRLGDLRDRAKSARAAASEQVDSAAAAIPVVAELSVWERELLEIILLEPEGVAAAAEVISPEKLRSPLARAIFARCCQLSQEGITPDFDRLLLEFDEQEIKTLLVDLDEQGRAKTFDDDGNMKPSAEPTARLRDLLATVHRGEQQRKSDQQARRLREQDLDADEELALLEQMIEQERTRQGISSPMEG